MARLIPSIFPHVSPNSLSDQRAPDLVHGVKGFVAPETKAAVEQTYLLIEQPETLGEPPEDPLPVLPVLWGFWFIAYCAFIGDDMRKLAAQFFILSEKHGATVPFVFGHRMMGITRVFIGEFADALAHFDQALGSYDPARHVATHKITSGLDAGTPNLSSP